MLQYYKYVAGRIVFSAEQRIPLVFAPIFVFHSRGDFAIKLFTAVNGLFRNKLECMSLSVICEA